MTEIKMKTEQEIRERIKQAPDKGVEARKGGDEHKAQRMLGTVAALSWVLGATE